MASLLLGGCSQKITIKAIKSAKVTDSSIKNIGVAPFENDNIAQSSQIDSAISNVKLKGKKYFNLIDRKNIDKVMSEKKLNDSGLVDLIKDDSSTGLVQMETLLTGKVNVSDISSSSFQEERTDYNTCIQSYVRKGERYCSKYRKYNVSCKANIYNVKTKVKLIKVSDSTTIFTQTYLASRKYKHCTDDKEVLPTKKDANTKLAQEIANKLIVDIAPSYIYFTVKLLDDLDIDVTSKQEAKFEIALKMIDLKRIQKAHDILDKLNNQLKSKSYIVLYNLSITEESLGDVKRAYKLIQKAENISLETEGVVEEIAIAMSRIKKNLAEKNKADKQL